MHVCVGMREKEAAVAGANSKGSATYAFKMKGREVRDGETNARCKAH